MTAANYGGAIVGVDESINITNSTFNLSSSNIESNGNTCNVDLPNTDPLLAAPATTSDGRTYYPLQEESPAIDAATNSDLSQDQLGASRLMDGDGDGIVVADLGAIEFQVEPSANPGSNGEAICGDGQLDSVEQCNDGNTEDGDGCSSTCLKETSSPEESGGCSLNPTTGFSLIGYLGLLSGLGLIMARRLRG